MSSDARHWLAKTKQAQIDKRQPLYAAALEQQLLATGTPTHAEGGGIEQQRRRNLEPAQQRERERIEGQLRQVRAGNFSDCTRMPNELVRASVIRCNEVTLSFEDEHRFAREAIKTLSDVQLEKYRIKCFEDWMQKDGDWATFCIASGEEMRLVSFGGVTSSLFFSDVRAMCFRQWRALDALLAGEIEVRKMAVTMLQQQLMELERLQREKEAKLAVTQSKLDAVEEEYAEHRTRMNLERAAFEEERAAERAKHAAFEEQRARYARLVGEVMGDVVPMAVVVPTTAASTKDGGA